MISGRRPKTGGFSFFHSLPTVAGGNKTRG
jgi:hypothetical protein